MEMVPGSDQAATGHGKLEPTPSEMEAAADEGTSVGPGGTKMLKMYKVVLFLNGALFLQLFPFAYTVQWGVAWHDAGGAVLAYGGSWRMSPYWDMICIMYTSCGAFLVAAAWDPEAFKPFLGQVIWGNSFIHGVVAFAHCFDDRNPNRYWGLKGENYDKLFVAVPLWFTLFATHAFFCKKCFGSFLLPFQRADCQVGVKQEHPLMKCYSWLLFLQGQAFLGLFIVAYLLQWGVAWHDAGGPFFTGSSINFNPYWDMIIAVYTMNGAFLTAASFSPSQYKALIGYNIWGLNFGHGIVAFVHCFGSVDPSTAIMYDKDCIKSDGEGIGKYVDGLYDIKSPLSGTIAKDPNTPNGYLPDCDPAFGNPYWAWKGTNYDKLIVAVPLWFSLGVINFYFSKKCFGSPLAPWQIRKAVQGKPTPILA